MYRQFKYEIKIEPLVSKNLRKNISAYYVMLTSEKQSTRVYSKSLLIDSQTKDEICSTNDIEFSKAQLWNYDKMSMIQEHHVVFSMCQSFTFTCQPEQIIYSITRQEMTKSNKIIGSTPINLSICSPFSNNSGRKNSEFQDKEILQKVKNNPLQHKKLNTQSLENSIVSINELKSPKPQKIITAKNYRAY